MLRDKTVKRWTDMEPDEGVRKPSRRGKNLKDATEREFENLPKHTRMARGWYYDAVPHKMLEHWLARHVGKPFNQFYSFVCRQLGGVDSYARRRFERSNFRGWHSNMIDNLTNPARWDNFCLDDQGKIQRHQRTAVPKRPRPPATEVYEGGNVWRVKLEDGNWYRIKLSMTDEWDRGDSYRICLPVLTRKSIENESKRRLQKKVYKSDEMVHNMKRPVVSTYFHLLWEREFEVRMVIGLVYKRRIYENS